MAVKIFVFRLKGHHVGGEPGSFLLHEVEWNDWWTYETLYRLSYLDENGGNHHIGRVKIAKQGQKAIRTPLPDVLKKKEGLFSVGQDSSYYDNLKEHAEGNMPDLFKILGDISYDKDLRNAVVNLPVTRDSLLRSVPLETVRGQFQRLATGGVRLTPFVLRYRRPETEKRGAVELTFDVKPGSLPPSNIHVLIGRNGVGKSTILHEMATGFKKKDRLGFKIASVVYVSFSAFDTFEIQWLGDDERNFHYIGLQKPRDEPWDTAALKNDSDLRKELGSSLEMIDVLGRRHRLVRALEILENDPTFAESGLSVLISESEDSATDEVARLYDRLSSGHKVVFLTMAKLVETVEEKTLLLIDEPESHLHPPLLSAYVRALSDLLTNRNGLAVCATHSPVLLQEVPRSCVWRVTRSGRATSTTRPMTETFGENVGTLTNEVFGLEVRNTGFNQILNELVLDKPDYQSALEELEGQLGVEGRAILRSSFAVRNSQML